MTLHLLAVIMKINKNYDVLCAILPQVSLRLIRAEMSVSVVNPVRGGFGPGDRAIPFLNFFEIGKTKAGTYLLSPSPPSTPLYKSLDLPLCIMYTTDYGNEYFSC